MRRFKKLNLQTPIFVTEPVPVLYCSVWEAHNEGDIKMALEGSFDFTEELAGRSISTGISIGTITSYIIDGITVSCSVPMSFTSTAAVFDTEALPVVAGEVLTSITFIIEIICTNASEISLTDTLAAMETPTQVDSYFDSCSIETPLTITAEPEDFTVEEDLPSYTFNEVIYTEDTSDVANPERGFYHHTETFSDDYEPLDELDLTSLKEDDKISIILRVFYLNDFKSSVISDPYLALMESDFEKLEATGMKAIVRFAYSGSGSTIGNWDTDVDTIKGHIDQLAPYMETWKHVITCFQAGFIGKYGEWYYTDYFGNEGTISPTEYADRKEVVDHLLDNFPSELQIQVRTPEIKQRITGETTPLIEADAFTNISTARLAHHNDAFLNDEDNEGTFRGPFTGHDSDDRDFVIAESPYLVMGGESNEEVVGYTNCTNAQAELAELNYSYLNRGYHPDVITDWTSNGCLSTIKKNLGYRFKLTTATFPEIVGTTLPIEITISNTGYTNPFNGKDVYLVLDGATQELILLNTDIRLWTNTITINDDIDLTGIASGNYDLYLTIVDRLAPTTPEYSIRLLNTSTWDSLTGFNNLGSTVTIDPDFDTVTYNAEFNVTVSGTVSTWQWQENQGIGWNDLTNGGIYSGVNTDTLIITGLTSSNEGWQYRIILNESTDNVVSAPATFTITPL